MKECSKCKIQKDLNSFANRKNSKDGKQWYCKDCMKVIMKSKYKTNPEKIKLRNKKAEEKISKQINQMKSEVGCYFCNEKEPVCLDFHHINPKEKDKQVSYLVRAKSLKRALEEIKKCICVCSNCHRKLHANLITI